MKRLPSASTRFRFRALAMVLFAALLGLAVAGVAGAGARHTTSSAMVKTRKLKGFGPVLVNAKGHTIYVFMKDKRKHVTCTGSCASFWPPIKQKGAHKATVGGAAKASLIGSDKDPAGGRVVTYSKWPLYTYAGDHGAGSAKGEGMNVNGGKWYVISPSGKVIKKKSSGGGGGGGTTTTTSWAG
jgi:predicted lipoprotein with Yx(FWY)xxD motif